MANRLPPGCGEDLGETILFNKHQQEYLRVKRLRFCMNCKTIGLMGEDGIFRCAKCNMVHGGNATAPRVYNVMGLFAGRQGGKTKIAAVGALQEIIIPKSVGWVMGATYEVLHDSTFPTLVRMIPPQWVKTWDAEHMEIRFTNDSLVAFRSLNDPERARGPKVHWGWFDEAAVAPERAYHVFTPTMATTGGAVTLSTSPKGFDWTWEQAWKAAHITKIPGTWAAKYKTIENPIFANNPANLAAVERKRLTMSAAMFRQEYEADFVNFEGAVYGHELIHDQVLDDERMKKIIPEWPEIDPSRQIIIGLDSGVDHPFGAVMIVVTSDGLVVVNEYLERQQALSQHLPNIMMKFGLFRFSQLKWAANKNEANLRLEWGLKNVGVIPAESKHQIGIQRVHSWLGSKQLYFSASMAPKSIEQMVAYRYATNVTPDGQRKGKEEVFKKWDELPDALRYGIMAWPELPEADRPIISDAQAARLSAFDDRTRLDLERLAEYAKQQKGETLSEEEEGYPLGDFFSDRESTGNEGW